MNNETQQDRTRAALEWARTHKKIDIHALNQILLAYQFNQLLEATNLEEIKTKFGENPKEFLELARTLLEQNSERTKRMKIELELRTYRDQVAEHKRRMKEALTMPDAQKGLSPQVLQQIEEAMANL